MKFAPPGSGAAFFAFSGNGTMVSIPDPQQAQGTRALAIEEKAGHIKYLPSPTDSSFFARLSPNGTQVAMSINDAAGIDIWVYDLSGTSSNRRLTTNQSSTYPVWAPDGQRIVFKSGGEGD